MSGTRPERAADVVPRAELQRHMEDLERQLAECTLDVSELKDARDYALTAMRQAQHDRERAAAETAQLRARLLADRDAALAAMKQAEILATALRQIVGCSRAGEALERTGREALRAAGL